MSRRKRQRCVPLNSSWGPETVWQAYTDVHGPIGDSYAYNYSSYLTMYPIVVSGTLVGDALPPGVPSWNDYLESLVNKGTPYVYNLPQWKKDQHVGHCWAPCPFSTESSYQRTRQMIGDYVWHQSLDVLANNKTTLSVNINSGQKYIEVVDPTKFFTEYNIIFRNFKIRLGPSTSPTSSGIYEEFLINEDATLENYPQIYFEDFIVNDYLAGDTAAGGANLLAVWPQGYSQAGQYKIPDTGGSGVDAVLNSVLGYSRTDHGIYYMQHDVRGSWGFECTDPNCPYLLANGVPYFYV